MGKVDSKNVKVKCTLQKVFGKSTLQGQRVNNEEGGPTLARFCIAQSNLPKGLGLNNEVLESTFPTERGFPSEGTETSKRQLVEQMEPGPFPTFPSNELFIFET